MKIVIITKRKWIKAQNQDKIIEINLHDAKSNYEGSNACHSQLGTVVYLKGASKLLFTWAGHKQPHASETKRKHSDRKQRKYM